MKTKEEIIKELREVRMQIAFTAPGNERINLSKKADELHKSYAKSLYKEKSIERKRGKNND